MKKNTSNWAEQVNEMKVVREAKIKDFKKISRAIDDSNKEDRTINIKAEVDDVVSTGEKLGYEVDYSDENDGSTEVWGWTKDTPDNEQDWKLSVK